MKDPYFANVVLLSYLHGPHNDSIAREYRRRDRRTNARRVSRAAWPKKMYDIMPLIEAYGGYTYRQEAPSGIA